MLGASHCYRENHVVYEIAEKTKAGVGEKTMLKERDSGKEKTTRWERT